MQTASDVLQIAVTVGFVLLALGAAVQWVRTRERVTAFLALALGLLAVVTVVGEIDRLTDERYEALSHLSLAGFLASGYLLLLFRHEFLPLSGVVRWGALAALVVIGALVTIFPAPENPDRYEPTDWALILGLLVVWGFCVGEPALRFWRASRDRPVVQRARLRGLSAAYGTLIFLILIAVFAGGGERVGVADVVIQAVALLLVPVLYASLAPPRWLRSVWRAKEEESLRVAEKLAEYAPDTKTVAGRALEQAVRLVGAESAFLRTPRGEILAARDITDEEAQRLGAEQSPETMSQTMQRIDGRERHLVLLPTKADERSDVLGVVLGPFAPLFGSDEVARLRDFAALTGVALDRVRLVEQVQQETARYEALLQAVSDVGEGFVVTKDGRCLYANEAYCEMTGYTLPELQALPSLLELSRPEDRAELTERLQDRLAGQDVSEHYESALVRKDGNVRWVEAAVKMLETDEGRRVVSIVRDITERKEAERSLARHTSTLQLLQRIAVAANEAVEVDDALRAAVQEVCAYTGWPLGHVYLVADELADELVSTDIWCDSHPGSFEEFKEATGRTRIGKRGPFPAQVLDTATPVWVDDLLVDQECERSDAARKNRVRSGFAFPILAGKEVAGALEFFNDQLSERNEALLDVMSNIGTQLGRVAERKRIETFRNEFISNAAHELRTPVTPIVGYSSLLADRWTEMSDEDRETITRTLRQQGNRLRTLVNSLLDFTRVQRGRLQIDLAPVHLDDVFANVIEAVPPPDGKNVDVAATNGIVVYADQARLEDMIVNLLVNAYRYGGDSIRIGSQDGETSVLVFVADNGSGVAPDLVPTLFDPFTRGETSVDKGGSGLGLAIVRMLAKAQGGDVWYEPGDTPRFVLKLRRASLESAPE